MADFLAYFADYFDDTMSIHGWIALAISVVGIVALNLGLMHLARRPHQEFKLSEPEAPPGAHPPPANDDQR